MKGNTSVVSLLIGVFSRDCRGQDMLHTNKKAIDMNGV